MRRLTWKLLKNARHNSDVKRDRTKVRLRYDVGLGRVSCPPPPIPRLCRALRSPSTATLASRCSSRNRTSTSGRPRGQCASSRSTPTSRQPTRPASQASSSSPKYTKSLPPSRDSADNSLAMASLLLPVVPTMNSWVPTPWHMTILVCPPPLPSAAWSRWMQGNWGFRDDEGE
jgi:hypothetical protein